MNKHVYLIKQSNAYKIGKSTDIKRRLQEYSDPKHPIPLALIKIEDIDNCERKIQEIFPTIFRKMNNLGNEYYSLFDYQTEELIVHSFLNIVSNFLKIPYLSGYGRLIHRNRIVSVYNLLWKPEYKNEIQLFRGQRDPDIERVKNMEIAFLNEEYIPFHIECALSPQNTLVCIDGNHRRMLLDGLLQRRPSLTQNVILTIHDTKDVNLIKKVFDNLNKSISVPDMFVENIKISGEIVN